MTTFEWISIIGVLFAGFTSVVSLLIKILVTLSGKVSYKDCSEKRDTCPCVVEFNERMKDFMSKTRQNILVKGDN